MKVAIILEGIGGELDRREFEISDRQSNRESEIIGAQFAEFTRNMILRVGDKISIETVSA